MSLYIYSTKATCLIKVTRDVGVLLHFRCYLLSILYFVVCQVFLNDDINTSSGQQFTSNTAEANNGGDCCIEHGACVWRPIDVKSGLASQFGRVRYQGAQNYILADRMLVLHQRESR